MIALPVMRGRVAPVLNWCSRIQIFEDTPSHEGISQELFLPHLEAALRLQMLREKGVNTLICGALTPDLLRYAGELGLTVVSGVAGEVHEVMQSYWQNTLDHPKFWLPGCRGLRRYRSGWLQGKGLPCNGPGRTRRRGRNNNSSIPPLKPAWGPGGFCQCPACGVKVSHEQGIPCAQVRCPRCGESMERV